MVSTHTHSTHAPLVAGLSATSFVTNDGARFDEAVRFYRALRFQTTREFTKDNSDSFQTRGISRDSVRETWLQSFPLGEQMPGAGVDCRMPAKESRGFRAIDSYTTANEFESEGAVLKLRLASSDVHENTELHGAVNFFSASIPTVQQILRDELHAPVIASDDARIAFYTRDPLGNTIGFTPFRSATAGTGITDPDHFLHPAAAEPRTAEPDAGEPAADPAAPAPRRKIAVMTSGGDSPGMCAAVRAVVRAGIYLDCDVYGCYEGYSGLVQGGDLLRKMEWEDVRGWLSLGGTLIGTARCKEFRERAGRKQAAYNMVANGIDGLIVCGGDGSLTGADLFRAEWPSLLADLEAEGKISGAQRSSHKDLKIVGLVGSIDNDMAHTDATIGAFSSLERICEMVDYIDATAQSHSRAFVVEVMGRHCGWLGLMAGISTGADAIFIPERPPAAGEWQASLQALCKRHRHQGRRKTVVIVAEGAIDDKLNAISSEEVKDVLVQLGLDTRITTLGHVQRGGTAVAFDRMLATLQGVDAVHAILELTPDTPSPMIGILENKIVRQPLVDAVKATKSVATAIDAGDFDKAMSLRDSTFADSYRNFLALSAHDDGSKVLPVSKQLNIACIHVGAPSSGLNAATRAACLYSLSRGHSFFAIQNGFSGLIRHASIKELKWIDVEDWHNAGGSEIGTNRSLPAQDLGTVAYHLQKNNIHGLIIIGGFEAFTALHQLSEARKHYPIFNIPMTVIPATVSNNVPGTQYSLGSDTCLNTLVDYCDAVKQSASATRRRVFVVEVQGGNSGYVASYTGLVTGALAVYLPEKRITLRSIQEDIELLKENYANDTGNNRSGKMLIRNEKASDIYSTQLIADIIKEQGAGKFESRTGIPGHVQQGRVPSSMDRVNATRFAIKCCEFIEDFNFEINASKVNDNCEAQLRFKYVEGAKQHLDAQHNSSAAVIGINGSKLQFTSVEQLWTHEADFKLRKGKTIHWENMNQVNDLLSGRSLLRKLNRSQAS